MSGLATHWSQVPLDQLATIGSGVTKGRKLGGKATVEVPYLRVANVQAGHLALDEVKTISVLPEDVEKCRLEKGDILMTEGGDPDKLGRGAIWDGSIPDCIHQNHVFRVRLDRKRVLPEYFSRVLGSPWATGYFLKAAKQTTGIATINKTQLRAFPVPLPPLPEQKRIAAILDKADEIRKKRAEAIKLTEELLRSAFLEMFGDPVTNPKGWEVTTFGTLCDRYGGELQTGPFGSQLHAADYSEEGVPVTMPRDLIGGRISTEQIARVSLKHVGRLARHKLVPGDLVFSRRGDVARFAIAEPENAGWLCGTGCLRIRPGRAPLESSFLWTELRHPSVRTWLEGEAKGTTMLNLNTQILSRLPVRVPPINIQKKYARLVDMLRTPQWERMGNEELEQLSSSLTQRAFRGEL